jgi:hypothetical protein
MKKIFRVLLISGSLYACNNEAEKKNNNKEDSAASEEYLRDGSRSSTKNNPGNYPDPGSFEKEAIEKEITRQITTALLSSKAEINLLRSEISDSLTKSGLMPERRSLFTKTIRQLNASSDLINKELENILVTDLQNNRQKLDGIVKKMKASERELGSMIARLDKINAYIQVASGLIQSLLPVPPVSSKNNKEKY